MLRNIQIIANKYTEMSVPPVDQRYWQRLRKLSPKLRVHMVTEGQHINELVLQPGAPVKSIVYETPYIPVSNH